MKCFRNLSRGDFHRKILIHRQPDPGRDQAGRIRHPVSDLCREHGVSSATFYKLRSKYGGMDASMMSQLKELHDENRRLTKMHADALSKHLIWRARRDSNPRPMASEGLR